MAAGASRVTVLRVTVIGTVFAGMGGLCVLVGLRIAKAYGLL
jgi:hypothetical protein